MKNQELCPKCGSRITFETDHCPNCHREIYPIFTIINQPSGRIAFTGTWADVKNMLFNGFMKTFKKVGIEITEQGATHFAWEDETNNRSGYFEII